MDKDLTVLIKNKASELGADIVGIAPVERWSKAPLEHSPQGILPGSKSAISFGVHFLDSCVELSAREGENNAPGPALTQEFANTHVNFIGFRLVKYLQEKGFKALAVPSTLWWSFRPRKGAPRGWIGDLSNYYAAVAAGLGEIGWNNLCLTPEFGPWQRLGTVITDAELTGDPMYSGEPLCDKCKLCAKNCPMDTFNKETNGMIEINYNDERKFVFPNRNQWRCGLQENFMLDGKKLNPDKTDEEYMTKIKEIAVKERRDLLIGWNMGDCIKFCVPSTRRYFDREFSESPRRRRDAAPNLNKASIRQLFNEIVKHIEKQGLDILSVVSADHCMKFNIDLKKYLPTAESVIIVGQSYPDNIGIGRDINLPNADKTYFYPNPGDKGVDVNMFTSRNGLWLARIIQERYGFDVVMETELDKTETILASGAAKKDSEGNITNEVIGRNISWCSPIITSIPIAKSIHWLKDQEKLDVNAENKIEALTERVKALAYEECADLIGIAPVSRLDNIADQLEKIYDGKKYYIYHEVGFGERASSIGEIKGMPHSPEKFNISLKPKKALDYLKEAKSAIVVAVRLPDTSLDVANKPPAFKAGHYAASVHRECYNQLSAVLLRLAKYLSANGHKVYAVSDYMGMAGAVNSWREVDLTASRFAAIAAGLGELGWNGLVHTSEYGARQRFAVLLTDAELEYNPVYSGPEICAKCGTCIKKCSTCAILDKDLSIEIEGKKFTWKELDMIRCDWSKRYAFVAEAGPVSMGSTDDFTVPEIITEENLKSAIMDSDKYQKYHQCPIVEKCLTECPSYTK